jgi:alanyl-tRNA synthetase
MVRVVSIGAPVAELLKDPGNEKWRQFSIEFCGGHALEVVGRRRHVVVTAEESVSKGIRRIVALTGDAAKAAGEQASAIDATIARAKGTADAE